MLEGICVIRRRKNQRHPKQCRQPVFEECAEFEHGESKPDSARGAIRNVAHGSADSLPVLAGLPSGNKLKLELQRFADKPSALQYDWICQATAYLAQRSPSMKQFFLLLLWAGLMAAVAVQASPPAPDLIARVHFAGAGQISADTNAVAFTNLWCSSEAQALREQTLNKLSHAPY